ncbi:hypothetical protein Q3G72_025323 [Acer saccharum]|nr:hypothetical protein Q3G72_025323 [Acer saccharum]
MFPREIYRFRLSVQHRIFKLQKQSRESYQVNLQPQTGRNRSATSSCEIQVVDPSRKSCPEPSAHLDLLLPTSRKHLVKRKREKITKLNRKTIQVVEPRRCHRSRLIRQTSPGCRTSRLLWTFGRIRHCRSSNPPDLSPNQLLLVVDAVTVAPHSSIFKSS